MRVKRTLMVVASLGLLLLGLMAATPAQAGTGLFYKAVDADNDPYSGIYLRDGTSMSNVRRITSRYMYYGNTFELICGTWGEAVGPYANRRWHNVRVVNGPAAGQTGWIADRYTNTPNKANERTPGEPECGSSPAPAPTYNGSVYYSPHNEGLSSPANYHKWLSQWAPGSCSTSLASNFPAWIAASNKYVTTLSGWSVGRLGPIYFLEANKANPSARWQEIDYILLFDPGDESAILNNECDKRYNGGKLYTDWLKANPNAKLVILAGAATEINGHRGIQVGYFNYLRANGGPRDRVLVCNYNGMGHQAVFTNFRNSMTTPATMPLTATDCPGSENWAWHP